MSVSEQKRRPPADEAQLRASNPVASVWVSANAGSGKTHALTTRVARLLLSAPGRVFTRLQLLEAAQGEAYEGYERTIDTHIKNLRRKLGDDPRDPTYVLTVHGVGYKVAESAADHPAATAG